MKRMLMGASWCAWLSVAWLVPGCGDGPDMLVDAGDDAGNDASTSDGSIDLGGDVGVRLGPVASAHACLLLVLTPRSARWLAGAGLSGLNASA